MFKIHLPYIAPLLVVIFFSISCRKTETLPSSGSLTLSTNEIHLDTLRGTQNTFSVKSTVSWTASVSPASAWLSMDAVSGNAGTTTIRLTALSNNGSSNPQTATITFSPVGNTSIAPVKLIVTQRPYLFSLGFRKALGGKNFDGIASQAIRLADGSIVMAGVTYSNDGDVHHNHGGTDAWVIKLNASGDTVWTKTFGGTADDGASSIVATTDNGFMVVGSTRSNDGDVHGNHGSQDIWLLKLNAAGDTVFTKTYGGSEEEGYGLVTTTPDGGYAVTGYASSSDGDLRNNQGGHDMWILKLNSNANIVWSKTYGGSNWDEGRSITTTPDGGFVIAGLTDSGDKDVTGYHIPNFFGFDMWVVKVDGNGNKIWAHAFGGKTDDVSISVVAANGGYVIAGYSNSSDGDITDYHGPAGSPLFYDMIVIRLDDNGNKEWVHDYGGTRDEYGLSIAATSDGGYVVAGGAASKNGDVSGYIDVGGLSDIWVVKINANGSKQWTKTIGSSGDDYCFSIIPVPEGFIIAGLTDGSDHDMTGAGSHGDADIWVTKMLVQ